MPARLRQRTLTATLALILASTLTACGGDSITLPTDDGSVKVDQSADGDITIETDDGVVVGGTGSLPAGFPEDEIPLIPGDIISSFGVDTDSDQGFTVVMSPEGDATTEDAVALLTAVGFEVESTVDMGIGTTASLRSPAWEVLVSSAKVDDSNTFTYTVIPNES